MEHVTVVRVWRESLCVGALLLLLATAMFPHAVLLGETLLPADLLYFYSPWRELAGTRFDQPSNWILFDELLEFAPWREYSRSMLRRGLVPLWDPSAFCGYPFTGVLQTAVFYPPDLGMIPVSMARFPTVRGLFHLLVAGLGMFWFVRRIPLAPQPAGFAAVLYSFSGFFMAWFGHPHFKVAAWLPFILLFTRALSRAPAMPAAAGLTATLVLQYLAGHIETSVHLLFAWLLYSLSLLLQHSRRRARFILTVLAAQILALLLAAVQLAPFAEYLRHSSAYNVRKHGVWVRPHFPSFLAWCLVQPNFFGSNADDNYALQEFNSSEVMGGFVGAVPLLFAVTGLWFLRRDRETARLAVLLLFGLGVVFKIPPIYQAVHLVPGMKMSYNFRFLLVVAFATAGLAARGAARVAAARRESCVRRWFLMGAPLMTAVGFVMYHAWRPMFAARGMMAYARVNLLWLMVLTSFCLLLVVTRSRLPRTLWWSALLLLSFLDLWRIGYGYNRSFPPGLLYPELPPELLPAASQPARIMPLGYTFPPHTCRLYGFHDIRGNDALTPLAVEEYLALAEPDIQAPDLLPAMRLLQMKRFDHPLLDSLNVRYVITPQDTGLGYWLAGGDFDPAPWRRTFRRNGVEVYSNARALPRAYLVDDYVCFDTAGQAYAVLRDNAREGRLRHVVVDAPAPPAVPLPASAAPPGTARFIVYDAHRLELSVTADRECLLILSDTYFPGWRAQVDGSAAPVLRVDHAFRGLLLEAGDHLVRFMYEPFSYRLGLFTSLIGALVCAAVPIMIRQRFNGVHHG
ncbi:YfhO family protein [bacterium]|nr:YfhO family protein [candidate division CSSED10-310 bacterium]